MLHSRLTLLPAATLAFLSAICVAQTSAPSATASSATTASGQAATPPSVTATSQTPPAPPPVFRSTANLVLIDVVVTNHGTAVQNLAGSKFHLLDNGKEQHLTLVEEHRATDAVATGATIPLPPHTYSDFPQYTVASAANVLLLDALNTPVADQIYVRRQMIQYLRNIPPGTRIAVFTLASRLRIVEGFTTDSTVLEKALSGGAQPSVILDPVSDQQLADVTNSMVGLGGSQQVVQSMQQFQADLASFQTDIRVRITIDAMQQLARYLSMVPGRKNLIWFSGSFPLYIDPDETLPSAFEAMRNYSDDIRETDDMLSSARVAVYPVDGRGLMTLPSVDASKSPASNGPAMSGSSASSSSGAGGRRGSGGSRTVVSTGGNSSATAKADMKFMQQTTAEHASMQQIAEETGGQPYYDTNGLKEAVGKAIENGSSYYTLGYTPDLKQYDGAFRRVQVRVDVAGAGNAAYELAYRRGYYADDPAKASNRVPGHPESIAAALQRGAPPISQILFKVRVLPADAPELKEVKLSPDPAGELAKDLKPPLTRYSLDFAIDPRPFAYSTDAQGRQRTEVEVATVAFDADGKRLNFANRGIAFNLKPEDVEKFLRSGIPFHQEIDLPAGPVYLRVAVHDLLSGRIGSTEIPVAATKK
jgi:VWFA-related protein